MEGESWSRAWSVDSWFAVRCGRLERADKDTEWEEKKPKNPDLKWIGTWEEIKDKETIAKLEAWLQTPEGGNLSAADAKTEAKSRFENFRNSVFSGEAYDGHKAAIDKATIGLAGFTCG